MIGVEYATAAARALLGDTRGGSIPATVWLVLTDGEEERGARVPVPNTDDVWGEAEGGATNVSPIEYGAPPEEWIVDGFSLFDAETGGDLILSGVMVDAVTLVAGPVTVPDSVDLVFEPGALVVTVT